MTADAHRLESHLFRQYWDDGLLDLFAGVAIVLIGVCWAFDLVAIGAVVPAVLVPFWPPLRRRLVEPRAGFVEFSDARTGKNRRLLVGSLLLGTATLAAFVFLWFVVPGSPWIVRVVPGVPAFLLAVLAVLTSLGLGIPRFLSWAAVLVVCGAAVAAVDAPPERAMLAGGALIAVGGAWLLWRFLQTDVEPGEAE